MALPSSEYSLLPELPETPIQQATGLFIESTESYLEAIQAGMVATYGLRKSAVQEVARRAELMASSVQMLAGIIYDSGTNDRNTQVAELLSTNEQMHATFFRKHLDDYPGTTDDTETLVGHLTVDLEHFSNDSSLSERDIFLKATGQTCLINAQTWMKILNDWGKGL